MKEKLIQEKEEIDEKIKDFKEYLGGINVEELDIEEYVDLYLQESAMCSYSLYLANRINRL